MTIDRALHEYQNGNVHVCLYADGTKIRTFEGTPEPLIPESIDFKITDWCDGGCTYCHESSTKNGLDANAGEILGILAGLPPGVEVAIGGGDPLAHPDIVEILSYTKDLGLVANVTINGKHILRHKEAVKEFRRDRLIHGLGVSFDGVMDSFDEIADDNTVVHFIAGEYGATSMLDRQYPKSLILGYKEYGRGAKYFSDVTRYRLRSWRYWLPTILEHSKTTAFDNLALEQLEVKTLVSPDVWQKCYMGGDGTFTMYVDAVQNEFAVSSTSTRQPCGNKTIQEMFAEVRNQSKEGLNVIF